MYPPVDYPINDETAIGVQVSDDLTYAALLDRHESEEVITEAMIQSACLRIETAQQFPFASKPKLQAHTGSRQESLVANLATTKPLGKRFNAELSSKLGNVNLSTAMDLNAIAQPAAKVLSRWIRIIS